MMNITAADVNKLIQSKYLHKLRPWIGDDCKAYISVYKGSGDRSDTRNYYVEQVGNANLRKDEWIKLDKVIRDVETEESGINDLKNAGLVYNLGDMDTIPLPTDEELYSLNTRELETNRNRGLVLDTTKTERAAKKVLESLEEMLFTNKTCEYAGKKFYSYINHPHRSEVKFEGEKNWSDSAKTPDGIIKDISNMKEEMENLSGPFVIYIPPAYKKLLNKYCNNSTKCNTIRDCILAIDERIEDIKIADLLPDNNILLVNMRPETVKLLQEVPLTNIKYSQEGPWSIKYSVFTTQVLQICLEKGQRGLVHMVNDKKT